MPHTRILLSSWHLGVRTTPRLCSLGSWEVAWGLQSFLLPFPSGFTSLYGRNGTFSLGILQTFPHCQWGLPVDRCCIWGWPPRGNGTQITVSFMEGWQAYLLRIFVLRSVCAHTGNYFFSAFHFNLVAIHPFTLNCIYIYRRPPLL